MKLLAALAATTATELNLSKATAVAVYASAITIIKTVANDGTEGGTGGTVLGSVGYSKVCVFDNQITNEF